MARYKKNVKRIDPRYFLNETVNRLSEAEGDSPEDIAAQINKIPGSSNWRNRASGTRSAVLLAWTLMKRSGPDAKFELGGRRMTGRSFREEFLPHIQDQDLVAFATEVLELMGEA